MREAVIFPKPEEVNIIATRNGELTNIPGTEFRTPLAPYTTKLWVSDNMNAVRLSFYTSYDVTAIPLAIVRGKSPYNGDDLTYYRTFAKPLDPYTTVRDRSYVGYEDIDFPNFTQFGAELLQNESEPSPGDRIGYLLQLIGNKTTQIIDGFNNPDQSDVILPPCYSERVLFWTKNPVTYSKFWQPYEM